MCFKVSQLVQRVVGELFQCLSVFLKRFSKKLRMYFIAFYKQIFIHIIYNIQ